MEATSSDIRVKTFSEPNDSFTEINHENRNRFKFKYEIDNTINLWLQEHKYEIKSINFYQNMGQIFCHIVYALGSEPCFDC